MCQNCKSRVYTKAASPLWVRTEAKRRTYYRAAQRLIMADYLKVQQEIARRIEAGDSTEGAVSACSRLENMLQKSFLTIYQRVGGDFAQQRYAALKRVPFYDRKSVDISTQASAKFEFYLGMNRYPLIKTITDTAKFYFAGTIAEGVERGLGVDQISAMITDTDLMDWQVNRIVRTEVVCASNLGDMTGAQMTGYDVQKEWIAAMQPERTRQSHMEADGQVVGVNDPFVLDDGDKLMFPADGSLGAAPENTINCRCSLGYTIGDDQPPSVAVDGDFVPAAPTPAHRVVDDQGLPITRDVKEIERLIQDINPNIETDIPENADPETVAEHYRAINWVNERCGGFKSKLRYTYETNPDEKDTNYGWFNLDRVNSAGEPRRNGRFAPQNIQINQLGDRESQLERLRRSTQGKNPFFGKGSDLESTMVHELAHYVDYLGGLADNDFVGNVDSQGRARGYTINVETMEHYANFINRQGPSEQIMTELYRAQGIDIDSGTESQIQRRITRFKNDGAKIFGQYAKTDDAEFIAMAVEYEYNNPGENPVAEQITDLIFKRYRRVF